MKEWDWSWKNNCFITKSGHRKGYITRVTMPSCHMEGVNNKCFFHLENVNGLAISTCIGISMWENHWRDKILRRNGKNALSINVSRIGGDKLGNTVPGQKYFGVCGNTADWWKADTPPLFPPPSLKLDYANILCWRPALVLCWPWIII